MKSDTLFLITARGGSKGVPGKNIKLLNNKPLLLYTLEAARNLMDDKHICLSTDSPEIRIVAEEHGLSVPFVRPAELSGDSAGSYEVILHALNYFKNIGREYKKIVLLQPTSPFRASQHISEALESYSNDIDMVVSVCESETNPYLNLFEEDQSGYLRSVEQGNYTTRQSCPASYYYNGAIYIINTDSLISAPLHAFKKVVKYVMPQNVSVDIDTLLDWQWAEFLIERKLV